MTFIAPAHCSMVLHGFAGYFHSTLYGDVHLSIVPQSHTPGMSSWFPVFFPLLEPLRLRPAERITLHMWRCCGDSSSGGGEAGGGVWYEWCLSEPVHTVLQNAKGRSYKIGT